MTLREFLTTICVVAVISSCSGAPQLEKRYEHHIMLPILQQQALRYYQQNYAAKNRIPSSTPASAKVAVPTTQQLSPREKLSWSRRPPADTRSRAGASRKIKRQDLENQNAGAVPATETGGKENKMMGRSMQADPNEFVDGLVPNGGPYSGESLLSDNNQNDAEQNTADDVDMEKKASFKSWDEFKEVKNDLNMRSIALCKDCGPLQYTPVVDPDKHFRDVDKLFRKKNERVQTFYDLNAFMKKQGKKFQFSTKIPLDRSQLQPTH